MLRSMGGVLAAILMAGVTVAHAQGGTARVDYPLKPVRVVVGFPARLRC